MESQSPDSVRVRSASARVAASSCVRISERKRTARTRDTSKSASSNTETERNNQRSLLEGGVGSLHAPVSAVSLNVAIRYEGETTSLSLPARPCNLRTAAGVLGFQYFDGLPAMLGDGRRLVLAVIEDHDGGLHLGDHRIERFAHHPMLQLEAAVPDPCHSGAGVDRIGVSKRPLVVARNTGQYRPDARRRQRRPQADAYQVFHARRLAPAQVRQVVHVPESVMVSPLQGDRNHDGKIDQRFMAMFHLAFLAISTA